MLAGVSVTLFVLVTELILSSNLFLMFLVIAAVRALAVLTTFVNHVRMFNAVRAHRNHVLDVAVSRATILRRERTVAYQMMILIAASLIRLAPSLLIKAFQSSFIEQYRYLFPWAVSFALMNASVNPIINFWWNKELRNAMNALVSC